MSLQISGNSQITSAMYIQKRKEGVVKLDLAICIKILYYIILYYIQRLYEILISSSLLVLTNKL